MPSTSSWMRRLRAAASVTLCLLVAPAAASAAAPVPVQGLYDSCSPATGAATCAANVQRLGGAGFGVVLNYSVLNATRSEALAYADAAAAAGVKVIWPLSSRSWRTPGAAVPAFRRLAGSCGCTTDDELLASTVSALAGHPATWGWYIGDEVPAAEVGAVQALGARVRAIDPAHPQLYIANGHTQTLFAELAPFAGVADVGGATIYPVGMSSSPDAVVGATAAQVQSAVDGAGKGSAVVLQAFSWAQYPGASAASGPRWPTRAEMQAQRDAALRHSRPSMLLWYSLQDVTRSDDPAGHFADVVAAAMAPGPQDPVVAPAVEDDPVRTLSPTTRKATKKRRFTKRQNRMMRRRALRRTSRRRAVRTFASRSRLARAKARARARARSRIVRVTRR